MHGVVPIYDGQSIYGMVWLIGDTAIDWQNRRTDDVAIRLDRSMYLQLERSTWNVFTCTHVHVDASIDPSNDNRPVISVWLSDS